MTPALALLLLGARIPVDPQGMALSITQIVLVPVLAGETAPFAASITILIIVRGSRCAPAEAMQSDRVNSARCPVHSELVQACGFTTEVCDGAGLTCSQYFPGFVVSAKPFLTLLSLLDTCACVGASLASNSATARSSTGLTVLVPVMHLTLGTSSEDLIFTSMC